MNSGDYNAHVIGTGSGTAGRLIQSGFGLGLSAYKPFLKARSFGTGAFVLSPEVIRDAGAQIVSGSVSNAGSEIRTGCYVSQTSVAPNPPTVSVTQIGSTVDGDEAFAGDIAEILVYERLLTDAEETSVLQYLQGRYGATVSSGIDSDNDGVFDECDTGSVYLSDEDGITVDLIYPPALTGGDISYAIDVDSSTALDPHTSTTHVEANTYPRIEIAIDLSGVYDIETVHFWNYFTDRFGVDSMTVSFYTADRQLILEAVLTPRLAFEHSLAEDFRVNVPGEANVPGVRYIEAELRGSDGDNTEFMNIGFTGIPVVAQP